jgi:hypothetical protein
LASNREIPASTKKTTKTAYPPNRLCSKENAKREVDTTGPVARAIEMAVWLKPFVAPRDRLLGADDVTKMNMEPEKKWLS